MKGLPRLPYEIISKILFEYKGIQTPTARIIQKRIDEWEEHKLEGLELIEQAHIHIDEYFYLDWTYFALHYEKSIYKILFIFD